MVTVRLFAAARAAAGTALVTLEPCEARDLAKAILARTDPALAGVLPHCALMANGARLDATSAAMIEEGTVVDVLPPFAGG